ncbi:unnamed protein product [Urochloa decumbens]|uniref:Knottins-like domain-containing protein n=1 Tax=Urochloa decumbens TaxID=240449 RepID=A0ABC9AW41_9POAL
MAPSPRNLSAATVLLLLVFMAAEMSSVAGNTCRHLSGLYHGLCDNNFNACTSSCQDESPDNIRGECHDFLPRCYCITNC